MMLMVSRMVLLRTTNLKALYIHANRFKFEQARAQLTASSLLRHE